MVWWWCAGAVVDLQLRLNFAHRNLKPTTIGFMLDRAVQEIRLKIMDLSDAKPIAQIKSGAFSAFYVGEFGAPNQSETSNSIGRSLLLLLLLPLLSCSARLHSLTLYDGVVCVQYWMRGIAWRWHCTVCGCGLTTRTTLCLTLQRRKVWCELLCCTPRKEA